jgi:hypothetical protein
VPVEVVATRRAQQQVEALDRTNTRAFTAFLDDLSLNGCAALAYRLTGPVPLSRLCVKHLRGALRVVVAFESSQRVHAFSSSDRMTQRTQASTCTRSFTNY